MRKPRDFDAELKALNDKARQLKDRKLIQLGELVIATGADTLPVEQLAGALLRALESKDAAMKEEWRKRGAAFFHGTTSKTDRGNRGNEGDSEANDSGTQSGAGKDRA
jgi:hypothetical protein